MNCPKCGQEISETDAYCPNCGCGLEAKGTRALRTFNQVSSILVLVVIGIPTALAGGCFLIMSFVGGIQPGLIALGLLAVFAATVTYVVYAYKK